MNRQDVRDLVAFIFRHFGPPSCAGELPDDVVHTVRRLEAALSCPPSDLVLVPREPTQAMTEAASKVVFREAGQPWIGTPGFAEELVANTQRQCYSAMIAAAGADAQPLSVEEIIVGRRAALDLGWDIPEHIIEKVAAAMRTGVPSLEQQANAGSKPSLALRLLGILDVAEEIDDADLSSEDPARRCVSVGMRPEDFEETINDAARTLAQGDR